jgi:bifunctional non-homologous end joining protein LigD
MNPAEKRLAVLVEDHPLEYIDFEGIIPQGQYGAGAVVVWDSGTYEPLEWKEDRITFSMEGDKLKGGFALTLLKGRGKGNDWLLIKKRDAFARPDWTVESALTPGKLQELKASVPPCAAS